MNPRFASLKDLKISVFCGGASSERKISLRSGKAVRSALRRVGLSAELIDPKITPPTRWKKTDLAFIALHGQGGEDGVIQHLLEKKKIPYTGAGPIASARAFDKKITKRIFIAKKIPTPEYCIINKSNWRKAARLAKGGVVGKPCSDGSSVGVFMADNIDAGRSAILASFKKYKELLIEKKIVGREFTVGILDERALPVVELIPQNSFYDYQAKYTKGMTQYRVPAPISKKISDRMRKIALRAHKALGLRDFSRVDIMMDAKQRIYVLEANSIPGLTSLSLLPKAARAAGISFEFLCVEMLSLACARINPLKDRKVKHG